MLNNEPTNMIADSPTAITHAALWCAAWIVVLLGGEAQAAGPLTANDLAYTTPGQPVTIPVLNNDQTDGTNQMAILRATAPAHGTLTLNQNLTRTNAQLTDLFQFAALQLSNSVVQVGSTNLYPRSTLTNGLWKTSLVNDWISGFFPGAMWYMYEQSAAPQFRTWAQNWSAGIASQQYDTTTDDLGFMINSSFGAGYRLTDNPAYKPVVTNAAYSVVKTRYNSEVGCVGDAGANSTFSVILDSTMNMELLFNAASLTGSASLSNKAFSQITQTVKNHIRSDGSTWHMVTYNANTGAVVSKGTRAGASTNSTWARGHAWATYGFTMAFRQTRNPGFLDGAQRVANYYLAAVPSDYVPYWDFQAPGIPDAPKDSSAAAITLSALVQLSQLVTNLQDSAAYWYGAWHIFDSLASTNYLARSSPSSGILLHGVGEPPQFPSPEVDVSLIYSDYYFVEALRRMADIFRQDTVTYSPDPGFQGTDAFTYQACDTAGNCSTATVTVLVDATLTNNFKAQLSLDPATRLPTISFPAVPEHQYYVQYVNSLPTSGGWQLLATNLAGTGSALSVNDTNPAALRFYRVGIK